MKNSFTLIEFIFVILVIGFLSITAIPKLINIWQNAESTRIIKTSLDIVKEAQEEATNRIYNENKQ
ncbi:pilus assembly FimT family protein [Caminibacter sp.]